MLWFEYVDLFSKQLTSIGEVSWRVNCRKCLFYDALLYISYFAVTQLKLISRWLPPYWLWVRANTGTKSYKQTKISAKIVYQIFCSKVYNCFQWKQVSKIWEKTCMIFVCIFKNHIFVGVLVLFFKKRPVDCFQVFVKTRLGPFQRSCPQRYRKSLRKRPNSKTL